MTPQREQQLKALRVRLNELGDYRWSYGDASDTIPGNSSTFNKKRIRIRNKVNTRLDRIKP
jgi:hypothetical protein